MKDKAIFWDRDGVINEIVIHNGKISSPWTLKEFKILPGVANVLEKSKEMGFLNIVFTNQPDISRGFLKKETLKKIHNALLKKLLINEIIFCPHDNKDNCRCRKPKPGMILKMAEKWQLDLEKSYVVGDTWKDIKAGKTAGCKTFLLRREYNKNLQKDYDFEIDDPKEIINIINKIDKK